jgi:hypothetical protein
MRVCPKLGVVAVIAVLAVAASPAIAAPAGSLPPVAAPRATLTELAQSIGGHNADPADAQFAYLGKLDGHLQDVAVNRPADPAGVILTPGGVAVDVYVKGDPARAGAALRALGMQVTAMSDAAPAVVEGTLPAGALAQAAALGVTQAIVPVIPPVVASGSVLSQGDAAIRGPFARALGPQGAGATVGIISDSIGAVGGGIADSQATGDLPLTGIQTLQDDPSGSDEGRAMAEIVHDEAPLAGIVFSTGSLGSLSKANAIDALARRTDVIADDVAYPGEPFFQDGPIAQAVDRAKASGVAYFASAGNQHGQAWEGVYAPTGDPSGRSATTEDFDPGAGIDTVQTVGSIPDGEGVTVVVQWAEPWGRATTDLAVDVYTIAGGVPTYLGTANTNNLAMGIPEEYFSLGPATGTVQFGIAIRRVAGSGSPRVKWMGYGDLTSWTVEGGSNSGAIAPDAASARGALAVAATAASAPAIPEPFSSAGPVVRYFDARGGLLAAPDLRQKPELASSDGVDTTVPQFAPFYGTSAAAPSAAGIAALIMGAKPSMSVNELYAIMTNPANALACVSSAPLADCGAGFILADRALTQGLDSTPPVIAGAVTPAAPTGANGWYIAPVQLAWSVSDDGSPVTDAAGCATSATADAATTFVCSASSAGGPASLSLAIRLDSTPPSAPAFAGISAGVVYHPTTLPAAASVGCAASDATSGVDSCTVTGYSSAPGPHLLTAVAVNDAGLSSSSTLAYSVAKPAAISGLTAGGGLTLRKLMRSGMRLTVAVATASTRLSIALVAKTPKQAGHRARTIALGTMRKTAGVGTARLRFVLTRAARRRLAGIAKATVTVSISASSPAALATKLQRSSVLRR